MINNIFSSGIGAIKANCINFMGSKKAFTPEIAFVDANDTFTSQAKNLAAEIQSKINDTNEELKGAQSVFPLQTQEYQEIKKKYYAALNESMHSRGTELEAEKEKEFKATQKEYNKKAAVYNATRKKIAILQKRIEQLEIYKKQNEIHPKTAFLYDPDMRIYDAKIKASTTKGIFEASEIARAYGLSDEILNDFIKSGKLTVDTIGDGVLKTTYIDETYSSNEEFLNILRAKKGDTIPAGRFAFDYNFTQSCLENAVKQGKIKPFMSEKQSGYSFLIDVKDETNAQTIEEHLKTTPIPSKAHYAGIFHTGEPITVQKLQKLGFGDAKTIAGYVKNGTLDGAFIPVQKKDGTKGYKVTVDVNSRKNESVLKDLRSRNQKTINAKQFAKNAGIKPTELKEAMLSLEVEIIPEYIFEFDHSNVFIDLNNEKNQEFLEKKLLEQEIEREMIQKRKQERNTNLGLRTKLALAMCPKLKQASRKFAAAYPEVIKIFEKIEQEGRDSITPDEEKALRIYYKSIWTEAGTDEYKSAINVSKEMISKYKEGEFEGISPEYLSIIQEYLSDSK